MKQNENIKNTHKKVQYAKYLLIALIVFLLNVIIIVPIVNAFMPESIDDHVSKVVIREAAAAALKKDPNELTDEDYAQITILDLNGKELSTLKTLEKFTNLQRLHLASLRLRNTHVPKWKNILIKVGILSPWKSLSIDLKPLKNLSELTNISAPNAIAPRERYPKSPIKDLKPLSECIKLEELSLSKSMVTNLEPLKKLKNLKYLSLDNTDVSSLEPLRKLTNIESLWLHSTLVENLEPISGLNKLKVLRIGGTEVTSLEPIENLKNMKEISFYNTKISDLESLKGMANLEKLNFSITNISDLEPISGLINLREVYLSETLVSNLEPLRNLVNLWDINICETSVSDLEPLKGLEKMYRLSLTVNENITDEQIDNLQKALPNMGIIKWKSTKP